MFIGGMYGQCLDWKGQRPWSKGACVCDERSERSPLIDETCWVSSLRSKRSSTFTLGRCRFGLEFGDNVNSMSEANVTGYRIWGRWE